MKSTLALLGLTMITSCQHVSLGSSKPVSAGALSEDYQRSRAEVRSKYDGKEIIVTGYVAKTKMPREGEDQDSVLLEEKESKPKRSVTCWFTKDRAEPFSKIKAGQYVTVKGVFNGEAGAELKFCNLVRIE